MAKNGTCELCGLPDDSYTIEEGGKVFNVCRLCHDGFYEKQGIDPSAPPEDPIEKLVGELGIEPTHHSKVQTLNDEQMKKILKPSSDEKRKLYASLRKASAQKGKSSISADTEDLKRMLIEANEEIEEEKRYHETLRRDRAQSEEGETEQEESADVDEAKRRREELEEEHRQAVIENVKSASASLADAVNIDDIDEDMAAAMSKLLGRSSAKAAVKEQIAQIEEAIAPNVQTQADESVEAPEKAKSVKDENYIEPLPEQISFFDDEKKKEVRAPETTAADVRDVKKLAAVREKLQKAANPTIDDERIKITSPEEELKKDTRPKTNFDVAVKEHVRSVRFIEAFKYVMHPATYSIFAGVVVLAIATALFIIQGWQHGVITLAAGAGGVCVGFSLVWYLKSRFEKDRRTYLLRIRQEQILFESMRSPCYRELKTKYPIVKALCWLFHKLSVLVPVIVIVGGTIASVVLSFIKLGGITYWWMLAPVLAGSVVAAVLMYYILKFCAETINYVLDIERNQQIKQQTLLDLLSKN